MKVSEAAKQWEECFGPDNSDGAGGCLFEDCPLLKSITIKSGDPSDENGEVIWRVEGCSLFARLAQHLKNKKPGKPYPQE